LLEGRAYLIADASYRLPHVAFDFGQQTLLWQSQRTTVQSGNASFWIGAVTSHAGVFRSHTATGKTAGTALRLGAVTINGDIFFTQQQRIFSGSVMERLSRHFSLSQFYTRSGSQQSLNFGGSFSSNPVSLSVGWQQAFIPFGNVPFQKVLSVTLAFQLPHGTTLNLASVAAPNGGTRWSAYGGTYAETPWLPGESSGRGSGRTQIGKYMVRGRVLDAHGVGVEGIAVEVNGQVAYSNADGRLEVRFKKLPKKLSVDVLLAESTAPGNWETVSCDVVGGEVQIRVARKP
jgi:hypothetical protein